MQFLIHTASYSSIQNDLVWISFYISVKSRNKIQGIQNLTYIFWLFFIYECNILYLEQ
jgi:hypothetical protein